MYGIQVKWSWKETSANYLELNRWMVLKEGNAEYLKNYYPYMQFNGLERR